MWPLLAVLAATLLALLVFGLKGGYRPPSPAAPAAASAALPSP